MVQFLSCPVAAATLAGESSRAKPCTSAWSVAGSTLICLAASETAAPERAAPESAAPDGSVQELAVPPQPHPPEPGAVGSGCLPGPVRPDLVRADAEPGGVMAIPGSNGTG